MSMELFLVGCYFLVELFNNNVLKFFYNGIHSCFSISLCGVQSFQVMLGLLLDLKCL